jgi:hypothetical protein
MSKKLKSPTDPEVLEEILAEIRATTRDEWIERLSRYPDWDPAWANNNSTEENAYRNGSTRANLDLPNDPVPARS